jgi:hypothetical protein
VLAAYATAPNPSDPLAALKVSERPEPDVPEGWTKMTVRAASINHHDLWTLKGVGLAPEHYPMILGTDASGIDEDGREVVVHSVIATPEWSGDETLDPRRTLLSATSCRSQPSCRMWTLRVWAPHGSPRTGCSS